LFSRPVCIATARQREICGVDQQSGRVPGTVAEELREVVQRSRESFGQFSEGRRRPELVPGRSRETAYEHGHQKPTLRGIEKRLRQSTAENQRASGTCPISTKVQKLSWDSP